MTGKEFVREMEDCYGPYLPRLKGYVLGYLESTWSTSRLDSLFDRTMRTYEPFGKRPPVIAVFERLRPQTVDAAATEEQNRELHGMYDRDRMVEDRSEETRSLIKASVRP